MVTAHYVDGEMIADIFENALGFYQNGEFVMVTDEAGDTVAALNRLYVKKLVIDNGNRRVTQEQQPQTTAMEASYSSFASRQSQPYPQDIHLNRDRRSNG